jgi:hypothetical protein
VHLADVQDHGHDRQDEGDQFEGVGFDEAEQDDGGVHGEGLSDGAAIVLNRHGEQLK